VAAIDVWDSLEQSVIDDAIDQWRSRLRVCVRAKGGHSNSLCNLHLNFIINGQYDIWFVTIDVECIVLI